MTQRKEISPRLKKKIKDLPDKPGIYQFSDKEDHIIYVGKAKSIKKRVSSYFTKERFENGKTALLVRKIEALKYIVVDTELEALLLENSLIKKYQPKYNIQLKDDKSFPWICIKNERFPRVFSTRTIVNDGSEYFGPYASVKMMNAILELVKRLHKLRNCNYNLSPENIDKKKFSVCLEYHIGNCLGPCENLQDESSYNESVTNIRDIINGNLSSVIRYFKTLMKSYAENYEYENAQAVKEKIELIEKYKGKSTVVNPKIHNVDVFSIAANDKRGYVNYMRMIRGAIVQAHTVELKKKLDETDAELLSMAIIELRQRFGSSAKEILLPFDAGLADYYKHSARFIIPKRGDKKRLLDLSQRNARYYMMDKERAEKKTTDKNRHSRILNQMKKDLRLKNIPDYIECIDNSNIQGTNPVAALVVFKNAKPAKRDYRHFNIKTVEGPDDFASMEEVVMRRYSRLIKERKPMPQLLLIDGGKGQLNSALKSLKQLKLQGKISVIGIAKRLEELYYPNDPVPLYLDKKSETLKVLQHLRNEAHRFGITHHRKKRLKGTITSELTKIEGIGTSTAQVLLRKFKSVKGVKAATKEELVPEIGMAKGALVFNYFN